MQEGGIPAPTLRPRRSGRIHAGRAGPRNTRLLRDVVSPNKELSKIEQEKIYVRNQKEVLERQKREAGEERRSAEEKKVEAEQEQEKATLERQHALQEKQQARGEKEKAKEEKQNAARIKTEAAAEKTEAAAEKTEAARIKTDAEKTKKEAEQQKTTAEKEEQKAEEKIRRVHRETEHSKQRAAAHSILKGPSTSVGASKQDADYSYRLPVRHQIFDHQGKAKMFILTTGQRPIQPAPAWADAEVVLAPRVLSEKEVQCRVRDEYSSRALS